MIHLSSQDLKELDISNNEINIVTVSDAQKWKYFLQSFEQCCVLKKIDFSGNTLGTRGIEILARVYIRSELDFLEVVESEEDGDAPEDLIREHSAERDSETAVAGQGIKAAPRRGQSASPDTYEYNGKEETDKHCTGSPQAHGSKHHAHAHTDAEIRRYACTRGLRSVPYIILQDVGMTNGAIVHLAEMLRLHRAPENLLSFLPGGKPPALPSTEKGPCGIYWLPNKGLSVLSIRLMQIMEEIKESTAEANSEDELMEDFEGLDMDLDYEDIERAQQERERRRRHRQKLTVNLGRTISQQRIHVLATEGLRKSVLWHCALRMLAVGRAILLDYTNRPRSVEEELIAAKKARLARAPEIAKELTGAVRIGPPPNLATPPEQDKPRERIGSPPRRRNITTDAVCNFPIGSLPYATPELMVRRQRRDPPPRGALISSFRFDPQSSTFDLMFPAMHHPSENPLMQTSPPPVAPAMPNYPHGIQEDSDFEHVSKDEAKSGTAGNGKPLPASSSSSSPPGRNGKKSTTTEARTDSYRSKYQFGLPLHLWQRIIAESMGVNGILHPDQQTKIINYAASWGALEAEISINGVAENQQIWKILDYIDCFTYKPLS